MYAHRLDPKAVVKPGETLALQGDLFPASDGTAPFSIYTFLQITGGNTIYRQAAIASDHFVFTGRPSDELQTKISQQFAAKYEIGKPHFADPGDGIFHFYFPEQGLIRPGGFYRGGRFAQSGLWCLWSGRHWGRQHKLWGLAGPPVGFI